METLDKIVASTISLLPFMGMLAGISILLWGAHWLLIARHTDLGNERKFPRQLILIGLFLLGLLATLFVLPISESSRNQLIGLVGILISGILAFSSTTIVANFMAGVLLRITKPFQIGDFIRVGDHFGRVSERGLFDTEIQTETRELVALPNTYCINHPVATIRGSGTIISASLSLGYDIGHSRIELLLMAAAENSGLEEPFVHILELGNFSITYRVSGFLSDTKRLISARSNLNSCVLDVLHGQNIEIVSPTYMNQRQLKNENKAIPDTVQMIPPQTEPARSAEDIAFDKADQAEKFESEKQRLVHEIENLESDLKQAGDDVEKKRLQINVEIKKKRLKQLIQAANETGSEDKAAEHK